MKFFTSAADRGSASIRRTWADSPSSVASRPSAAAASSASSGMLDHRKYDSRDATSYPLSRCTAPGFLGSGCAIVRNRNAGETRHAESAARTAGSNRAPRRRSLSYTPINPCTSALDAGRRYARLANAPSTARAFAPSSLAPTPGANTRRQPSRRTVVASSSGPAIVIVSTPRFRSALSFT